MVENKYKRRNYLINKGFQLRYTLSILALLVAVTLISGIGLYMGMWASIIQNFSEFKVSQDLETAKRIAGYEEARYSRGDYRLQKIFREAKLLSQQQKEALRNALEAVNESLLPKIVVLFILIFLGGIFVSHKIAGPMYRFERSAEAIKRGDLKVHFNIRRDDEMKKTASLLESMAESLRIDLEKIKEAEEVLKNEINLASNNLQKDQKEHIEEALNKIDKALGKYKT